MDPNQVTTNSSSSSSSSSKDDNNNNNNNNNITNPSRRSTAVVAVVVVRHGERLDYVRRASGENWCREHPEQPWNPPLTERGMEMARELGAALRTSVLPGLGLPPVVAAVYTSPFVRCRQTAAGIIKGMESVGNDNDEGTGGTANTNANTNANANENTNEYSKKQEFNVDLCLRVKVEMGLSESMNENWFRSWSIPGSDGTWGYKKETPIHQLLDSIDPRALQNSKSLLDWKQNDGSIDGPESKGVHLDAPMDHDHESLTSLGGDYSLAGYPRNLESFRIQRDRMARTMNALAKARAHAHAHAHARTDARANAQASDESTIVLVSHGGPVTHLYESLTGNHWEDHGVAKYCSFSIYRSDDIQCDDNDNDNDNHNDGDGGGDEATRHDATNQCTGSTNWTPLVVNRVLWQDGSTQKKVQEESSR